jgi:hypothetical protein
MTTYTVETTNYVIEISEGYLTIDTKRFPDDCVSLTPAETEEVLKLLLIANIGTNITAPSIQG